MIYINNIYNDIKINQQLEPPGYRGWAVSLWPAPCDRLVWPHLFVIVHSSLNCIWVRAGSVEWRWVTGRTCELSLFQPHVPHPHFTLYCCCGCSGSRRLHRLYCHRQCSWRLRFVNWCLFHFTSFSFRLTDHDKGAKRTDRGAGGRELKTLELTDAVSSH